MSIWKKVAGSIYDFRERLQQAGWQAACRWLYQTLVSLPYRRIEYTVFTRSLEQLPAVEPRVPITLRPAAEADLARFRGLVPPSELDHFARRLAHGRYCFLALDGEKLAAYCWAATQIRFEIDNLEIQLEPGDTYVDDAYTIPAYRRQGIQSAVHLYRLQYMQGLGCQRAILIVENSNLASQQLVRKMGYRRAGQLDFRRILWQRSFHYHKGKSA